MKRIIDSGAKVYEIHDMNLHGKSYIIDNKHFSMGKFLDL